MAEDGEPASVDDEAEAWVIRCDGGPLDQADARRLEAWLDADPSHRAAFERARARWATLDELLPAASATQRVDSGADTRRRPALAVAAALLITVAGVLGALWLPGDTRLRADAGRVETFALPDGTRATLEPGSAIAVAFDEQRRSVRLVEGRAWFEVAHGQRPFAVAADGHRARALGTAFEVDRLPDRVLVRVADGRVRVSGQGGAGATLGPGDRAALGARRTEIARAAFDPARAGRWRDGILRFRDRPVAEVLAVLERHGDRWIVLAAETPPERRISATLRADRPGRGLAGVAELLGLKRTRLPGVVILHR